MKKFIQRICIATALSILIIVVPIAGILASRYSRLQQAGDVIFAVNADASVVVLGDSHSHSFVGNSTIGIKKLTYSGSPLNVSLMRLKELERRGGLENIKYCAVCIDHASFCEMSVETQIRAIWEFMPFSLRYTELYPPVGLCKYSLYAQLADFTLSNLDQCPPIADGVKRTVSDKFVHVPTETLAERSNEWVARALTATMERHFSYNDRPYTMIRNAEDFLMTVIGEFRVVCERNNVHLIFVSTPLSNVYRDNVPDWAREKLNTLVDAIKNMGLTYYDYMDWGEARYFRDLDHLNKEGSEEFTKVFLGDVLVEK